jgi:hypothetical protein
MTTVNRKNLRYKPYPLESALLMFDSSAIKWEPDEVALIIDESAMAGAQLILRFTDRLKAGSKIKLKLGQLEPLLAEVVWRKEISSDLIRIGAKFLE